MKRFTSFSMLLLLGLSAWAIADQAAYIDKAEAERAQALLGTQLVLREFCEPCGDAQYRPLNVKTLGIAPTGYENTWEVSVNGQGVDLAYLYFKHEGAWHNVAMHLKIPVDDVSRIMDEEVGAE